MAQGEKNRTQQANLPPSAGPLKLLAWTLRETLAMSCPLRWDLSSPLQRSCALFRFVCYCVSTQPHPHPLCLTSQPVHPFSRLPFFPRVEASPLASDSQDPDHSCLGRAISTWVSPRIWGSADLKIVHLARDRHGEAEGGEWLALKQTIKIHDSHNPP